MYFSCISEVHSHLTSKNHIIFFCTLSHLQFCTFCRKKKKISFVTSKNALFSTGISKTPNPATASDVGTELGYEIRLIVVRPSGGRAKRGCRRRTKSTVRAKPHWSLLCSAAGNSQKHCTNRTDRCGTVLIPKRPVT